MGNFTPTIQGYRAIASAKLRNTGNVGIVLRVTARWDLVGSRSIKETKTVRLGYNQSKKVDFTRVLTQDQLDAMQQAALSFDDWCGVKAVIIDTFGPVHG